jgi:hypothetical protein
VASDGEWYTTNLKADETGILPERELESLRREMPD